MANKALTKEDLIYVLQGIFRISNALDNAFQKNDDGWYVKNYEGDLNTVKTDLEALITALQNDYQQLSTDFTTHTTDDTRHIDDSLSAITSHLTLDENGVISFKEHSLATMDKLISQEENNAIERKTDGIYAPKIDPTPYDVHINNAGMHVTTADKEKWNNTLDNAKAYCDDIINGYTVYSLYFVSELPTANIDDNALYLLADDPLCLKTSKFMMYVHRDGEWSYVGANQNTLADFVTNAVLEEKLRNYQHVNQSSLDKVGETDTGQFTYDGKTIGEALVDNDTTNAMQVRDTGLYVKDFSKEIKSLQIGATLSKVNLYNGEINASGTYTLKDSIDNYNLLLIEYYYKPDKEDKGTPGCIQTAVVDPDTLNDAYSMGMLYILQYGYGVMTSNSQIHIVEDQLTVDYYHNVCIYKITGIRKGES